MLVTTPADNPSPDQALIVTLFIFDSRLEDIDAYARELVAFGRARQLSEAFDEHAEKCSLPEAI
jgi:hypothetical protein